MSTKQRIIEESLDLFSSRGYDAVSVRDIARRVGIKESSLYNHFKNKQDIFDTIVDFCCGKAEDYFRERQLPFLPEDDNTRFQERDRAKLAPAIFEVFRYFFEDPYNIRFRRLLIVSQYENPKAAGIYRRLFRDYPLHYQEKLFSVLIEKHYLLPGDPHTMALEFYGPVFMMIHTCDGFGEALPLMERHLEQFLEHHAVPAE